MLIATDGSTYATRGVEVGLELALREDCDVTCLHVAPGAAGVPEGDAVARSGVGPDDVLRRAGRAADAAGLSYALEQVPGSPAEAIVDVANEKDVDLIVIGSRGRGLVTSAFLGSVSIGVLRRARCPVLVVKDGQGRNG